MNTVLYWTPFGDNFSSADKHIFLNIY